MRSRLAFARTVSVFLPLLPLASTSSINIDFTTRHNFDDDDANSALVVGSGISPYLQSPSFLLFAIVNLLIGISLVSVGHRLWRVTTGLGTGLLFEFLIWVIIANTISSNGFSRQSKEETGIVVWAIVTVGGIVGCAVGSWFWRVGVFAMGANAGLALAVSIAMMGNDGLNPVARWIVVGVLTGAGLVVLPLLVKSVGMALSTAMTGSFLLWLAIDLFVNEIDGMSLGLRRIFDHKASHTVPSYRPPVSTRVFLALIWCTAIASTIWQVWYFIRSKRQPFLRITSPQNELDRTSSSDNLDPDFASDYRLPSFSPSIRDGIDMSDAVDLQQDDFQRRYREAFESSTASEPEVLASQPRTSPLPVDTLRQIAAIQHTKEKSSPDEPPSRPNSVVSTAFAVNLHSRPPTFFDDTTRFQAPTAHTPPLELAHPLFSDPATFERRPSNDDNRSTAGPSPTENGIQAFNAFESGLASGNTKSIALTRSSPTTENFSTLLGANLNTPPLPTTPDYDEIRFRGRPDVPQFPTLTSMLSPVNLRPSSFESTDPSYRTPDPSFRTIDPSFRTADPERSDAESIRDRSDVEEGGLERMQR